MGKVGGTLGWRARVTGGMAGSLFLRSFDRADRIYAAMAARGYDGETRALPQPPLGRAGWTILVIGVGKLGMLVLIGLLL
jgi:cobalt/nickel transport system permease protein